MKFCSFFIELFCVTLSNNANEPNLFNSAPLVIATMKQLLSIILCLSFILSVNNNCFAQESTDKQQRGLHTIYVEALGNAFWGYSMGYDYTLKIQEKHKLSFKCGLGYVPEFDKENNRFKFGVFELPITPEISYLHGKKHHLELGVGVTFRANHVPWRGWDWTAPFRIGYRYQNNNGGLFLKVAATPFIWFMNHQDTEDSEPELWKIFMPFGGIALGYTFKSR
ncbi:MAG: hypothetical protein BWY08_01848 [Bacteroidetes bacterium ADurb.Bin174]|nr:MAG: hypothetical protein BWY08_01848 [Bacteroidetes bacterium ADurb.Bin174]